ncbi:MAG: AAA family ATPase [Ruminococcus callidus]
MGYPEIQDEVAILKGHAARDPLKDVQPVCTPEQLEALQQQAAAVYVDDRLYYYAASVSRATREHPQAVLGVSPRGTLALIQSAKAMAMLRGRDYLLPDDIMPLCQDVLAHRILTKGGVAAEQVLDEVLHQVPAPMPDRR